MPNSTRLSRRDSIAVAGAATLAATSVARGAVVRADDAESPIPFFVVGDTHYLANKDEPAGMDAASAEICRALVDALNRLPGTKIPEQAGGGEVATPRGVIHVGDIIDTGDKQGGVSREMQRTEWTAFEADYGLAGGDGRLKWPVFELHGNHDSPHGVGHAIERIMARNRTRPGVKNVSAYGAHCSWDWGHVHFVNLGLLVAADPTIARKRRYEALDSLAFLQADLKEHVGDSGRPVVVSHHLDFARHVHACDASTPPDGREWDPCDVSAFHRALKDHRVAAIFHGHTHVRSVFRWDGQSPKADAGIMTCNVDNGSHFGGDTQAVFVVEIDHKQTRVREWRTTDRWKTAEFTPQIWTAAWAG